MTSKAISKEFKCNSSKIGIDKNPYIQVDIDRLIGFMNDGVERSKELLKHHEGTIYEEQPQLLIEIEREVHIYEGLLGMIKANSFK